MTVTLSPALALAALEETLPWDAAEAAGTVIGLDAEAAPPPPPPESWPGYEARMNAGGKSWQIRVSRGEKPEIRETIGG